MLKAGRPAKPKLADGPPSPSGVWLRRDSLRWASTSFRPAEAGDRTGLCRETSCRSTPVRILRTAEAYFTRREHGRKRFVLGERPDVFKHLDSIDQAAWKQYETYLNRTTPLERAEFYARKMEGGRFRSIRALARSLGQHVSGIARHLKLLELSEPIRGWLREHRTPEYVRYFTEKRLRELLPLGDSRVAWKRFQTMIEEAGQDAGIWSAPQQ